MIKPLILVVLCFLSAAVLAADAKSRPALSEFDGLDADRDGRISAVEHAAGARRMFELMDSDGDGIVTPADMDAAYEEVTGRKASKGGTLTAADHAAAASAVFRQMDADRDGYLSTDEWTAGHAALMRRATR